MSRRTFQDKEQAQFEAQLRAMANYREVLEHEPKQGFNDANASCNRATARSNLSRRKHSHPSKAIKIEAQSRLTSLRVRFTPSIDERENNTIHAHKPTKSKRKRLTKDVPAQVADNTSGHERRSSWKSKLNLCTKRDQSKEPKYRDRAVSITATAWIHNKLTYKQQLISEHDQRFPYHRENSRGRHEINQRARSRERSRPRSSPVQAPPVEPQSRPPRTTHIQTSNPQQPTPLPPPPPPPPPPSSSSSSYSIPLGPQQSHTNLLLPTAGLPSSCAANLNHDQFHIHTTQQLSGPQDHAGSSASSHIITPSPPAPLAAQYRQPPPDDPYWQTVPPNPPGPRPGLAQVVAAALNAERVGRIGLQNGLAGMSLGGGGGGGGEGSSGVESRAEVPKGGNGVRSVPAAAEGRKGTRDALGRAWQPRWDKEKGSAVWGYW